MKHFHVKSIKVPAGVKATFFKQEFYEEANLKTKTNVECLDVPFTLSFL